MNIPAQGCRRVGGRCCRNGELGICIAECTEVSTRLFESCHVGRVQALSNST